MTWALTLDKINAATGDMVDYAEVNGQTIKKIIVFSCFFDDIILLVITLLTVMYYLNIDISIVLSKCWYL